MICRFKARGNCSIRRERCKYFGNAVYKCSDMNLIKCREKGCEKGEFAKGFCRKHYDSIFRKRKNDLEIQNTIDNIIFGPEENRWWEIFPKTPYMEKLL